MRNLVENWIHLSKQLSEKKKGGGVGDVGGQGQKNICKK